VEFQSTQSSPEVQSDGQLRWHCRRGMKELDVLLERFCQQQLPNLTSDERKVFARFLDWSDPDLYTCLVNGQYPTDNAYASLVQRILACRCS